ncbi:MAG: hypothetical protein EHM59_06785 [Betaproteobacteria bacterium]|nr:MAG: hypothetical protein EHM59_06785 [Betaproteobacteria bacterium]
MKHGTQSPPSRRAQRGAALIIALVFFALIGVSTVLALARGRSDDAERERRTHQALAEAKAALIGFAAAMPFSVAEPEKRLGDLPCPDRDDDGVADPPCSTVATRLGRLPWRTLGLADLRDGDGERLWYAVSVGFKNNPRTACASPQDTGCINSDSTGSITVRDPSNALVHDGRARVNGTATEFNYSAAIAVVIGPGAVLTRQGGAAQARDDAASMSNPVNYLDTAFSEDNANFVDHDDTNGFISGPIRSASGDVILNDRIAILTYQDLVPLLEKRVVREVSSCLDQYATANGGRYPWASDTSGNAFDNFADKSGFRAGRVPDGLRPDPLASPPFVPTASQALTDTRSDSNDTMVNAWPAASCNLGYHNWRWWNEWKLHVFYSVADAYKPAPIPPDAAAVAPACGSCLGLSTPTGTVPEARYFVAVGGRRLVSVNAGQPRSVAGDLANPANFLEGENVFGALTPDWFAIAAATGSFNDVAGYR